MNKVAFIISIYLVAYILSDARRYAQRLVPIYLSHRVELLYRISLTVMISLFGITKAMHDFHIIGIFQEKNKVNCHI